MLDERPMERTWFMAPTEYNPNGKGITVPKEYVLMVHSPNGKGMVLQRLLKKIQLKRYKINQN